MDGCELRAWEGGEKRKGEKSLSFPLALLSIKDRGRRTELERTEGRNHKKGKMRKSPIRAPRTSRRGIEMPKGGTTYSHTQAQLHT